MWALICGRWLVGLGWWEWFVEVGQELRVNQTHLLEVYSEVYSMVISVGYSCGTNHERERSEAIFKSRLERALNDSNSRPAELPVHGLYCQLKATRTSRELSKVGYKS